MNILGIGGLDHNGSIAYLQDGTCTFFLEAERVTRQKNIGFINKDILLQTLQSASNQKVDHIAIADLFFWKSSKKWLEPFLKRQFKDIPIDIWSHHECHAMAAYFCSGWSEATCITIDGKGDGLSTSCWLIKQDSPPQKIMQVPSSSSLGRLWWAVSNFCGLPGHHSAGKVMALAAYGESFPLWEPYLQLLENGGFSFSSPNQDPNTFRSVEKIVSWLENIRGNQIGTLDSELAASLQDLTETIILHVVQTCIKKTQVPKVCLSGGVALNGLANQRLLSEGIVENLYIPPCTDDRGLSLGAAARTALKLETLSPSGKSISPFMGPPLSSKIETTFWESDITSPKQLAELLMSGKIIAVCSGKDEMGPRALGHRSILASPIFPQMKDTLNHKIKKREGFRPFGIIILQEELHNWIEMEGTSPYMLRIAKIKTKYQTTIPSAMHIDETSRIQTVIEGDDSGLYSLLKSLREMGHPPILLNTSLNQRGEPLVHTLKDALQACQKMNIEWLWSENSLFKFKIPQK